jgi:AcrR family transcriptional regulator
MRSAPIDPDLVDAAARVLGRTGLGGLTISAIAEEAGISRVTLHRRGARIDDYVVAVVRRASDELREALWPAITAPGDAATRLGAALRALCEVTERHAEVLVPIYGVPARPLPDKPGSTTSFEFIEPFERLLRDGVVDGSLVSGDPRDDATLLANAVFWTYLHMRTAHRWPIERATEKLLAMASAWVAPDR